MLLLAAEAVNTGCDPATVNVGTLAIAPGGGITLLQYGRVPGVWVTAVPVSGAAVVTEYARVVTGEGPDGGNAIDRLQ